MGLPLKDVRKTRTTAATDYYTKMSCDYPEENNMKCPACHVNMIKRIQGEIELKIENRLYLVKNIDFEECSVCGERVLAQQVSQSIFNKIKNGDYKEEKMLIPVLNVANG